MIFVTSSNTLKGSTATRFASFLMPQESFFFFFCSDSMLCTIYLGSIPPNLKPLWRGGGRWRSFRRAFVSYRTVVRNGTMEMGYSSWFWTLLLLLLRAVQMVDEKLPILRVCQLRPPPPFDVCDRLCFFFLFSMANPPDGVHRPLGRGGANRGEVCVVNVSGGHELPGWHEPISPKWTIKPVSFLGKKG